METFLQLVAQDLYSKVGNDLSRVAMVFPNKRASLFFNEYLANQSNQPIWSPAYVSISELFQQLSTLKLGDPIRLVCELYKIFKEETGSNESLDDFYFWGELLIGDFDDVDKNLVDADKLFTNLKELKGIMDDLDYLDSEQEEAIRQFFQNFSIEKQTELKEKFVSLWNCLGSIYTKYKAQLRSLGIAYEGMMYRDVIESIDTEQLHYDKFVFVGFNVLNTVEHRFFKILQDKGKALFYWDYDLFYTKKQANQSTHEAGEFILRNLRDFSNELPASYFDKLQYPKKVRYISAPTENAQARYLPEWIEDIKPYTQQEKECAVVLCNEAVLLPVLHSIPDDVKNVNITMGFPLAQTPAYSFINALLELQTSGYRHKEGRYLHAAVQTVLKHPYTRQCSSVADRLERELTKSNRFYPLPSELKKDEFLTKVFTPVSSNLDLCNYLLVLLKEVSAIYRSEDGSDDIFNQLYRESLFKCYTLINRLYSLIESGELEVKIDTFKRLLNRLLTPTNIPFHGEPAIGMQIMGVLETRNLDFKNLLMLSLNEGQLPKSGGDSSFIPYNLRKAFGMTTIEHKNAVYAYYFYRLIQRAENITLMYNTSSDGLNRGEWSRFMLQFLVEWNHDISIEYLEAGQSPQAMREITIEKSPEIISRMLSRYDANSNPNAIKLSPSALNSYLDCRLRFYFAQIARLKKPDEVSAEIDSALFGTIFHESAEMIYKDLSAHGKEIREEDINQLLKDDIKLQRYVDNAFKKIFFQVKEDERPEYNGLQLINSKVITSYLRQLMKIDLNYTPFYMEGMEKKVQEYIQVETAMGNLKLLIGGTIDRIDRKDDTLRIVDYKTGGLPKTPESIEKLFSRDKDRANYIFQTFLYSYIMYRQQSLIVAPALLYIHKAANENYSPVVEIGKGKEKMPINNFAFYEEKFSEYLQELLKEVFDKDVPFNQTEELDRCTYCDFKSICKR